jgi:cytochrome P450
MVLDESLRLYPPAWGVPRQAIHEDTLGEYRIPAGALVDVSQWVTHRRPDFWDCPEVFDPERFTAERSSQRERFAYYPFGGGARQCIGNHFSMAEAQIILATLARQFDLELLPGQDLTPDPTFVLKPSQGLRAKLKLRD